MTWSSNSRVQGWTWMGSKFLTCFLFCCLLGRGFGRLTIGSITAVLIFSSSSSWHWWLFDVDVIPGVWPAAKLWTRQYSSLPLSTYVYISSIMSSSAGKSMPTFVRRYTRLPSFTHRISPLASLWKMPRSKPKKYTVRELMGISFLLVLFFAFLLSDPEEHGLSPPSCSSASYSRLSILIVISFARWFGKPLCYWSFKS